MKTIQINPHQEWQTSNLKVAHFRNGEPILKTNDPLKWVDASNSEIPAYCIPQYEGKKFKESGFLYNWYAVNDPRGLAPYGWFIPDKDQIDYMLSYYTSTRIACIELKSKSGWKNTNLGDTGKKINGNGTNSSGFNAIPIPIVEECGEITFDRGVQSYWLNEVDNNTFFPEQAYTLTIGDLRSHSECGDDVIIHSQYKDLGLPVRCLKKPNLISGSTEKLLQAFLKQMEDSSIKDEILQVVKPLNIKLEN